ncbi:MAG: hypothetical protein A2511_09345 [Deltaproteobacteria bacterium RIFOXYD12_FULL_50_9]|nr:MAG: hypothetical protein A2511_09345 [Deltaproteobacteria bacterium RIFOXYD12_FULL_50_9]
MAIPPKSLKKGNIIVFNLSKLLTLNKGEKQEKSTEFAELYVTGTRQKFFLVAFINASLYI